MSKKRNSSRRARLLKFGLIGLVLVVSLWIFLFFYMGYNVKFDLRVQVDSYLSSQNKNRIRELKKVSTNKKTFNFLKGAVNQKITRLSDFQGDLGQTNTGLYGGEIKGRTANVIMVETKGRWHVGSIEIYGK